MPTAEKRVHHSIDRRIGGELKADSCYTERTFVLSK